jgi:pimeloyl-ACP methyl ester carboxylesterase
MGGGIVSAISYKIPGIKKTLLLDPLQDAVSSHLWKRTYEMFISGEMTKNYQEFIVKKNNPTCHTFKLISSLVFDKNISLEIEKGLKKNIHPIYVFFGSKDDIIPPIDSINYLKKVIKPRFFHSILIKNAKHAPHETHIDFVVDEFVKILK